MLIKGTISRLVQGTKKDRSDDRVFVRPADPGVLRQLPGESYFASGEVAAFKSIEGLALGDEHAVEVEA